MPRSLIPLAPRSASLTLLLAALLAASVHAAGLADLTRRYARDDQRLAGCLRYERDNDGAHQQVWVLETGAVVKVAAATHDPHTDSLDEFSLDDDGGVYFAFRKVSTPKPGGGTRVTEERSYFDDSQTLQKTRRTADFPAGVAAQIAANTPAVKLDLAKLTAAARNNDAANQTAQAILKAVRAPQFLIHDPAKGAPAEWQQVKLVAGTLSPDGRYALAWAPAKKDFLWANYKADDTDEDFWVEPGSEAVVNFIVDLSTHRLAGKTPGVHFGVRQNYNHYECIMAWSADSHTFIELNTEKWSYAACGCGRLTDGKLVAVADLGPAVEARAKALLKTTKHPGYRNHAKDMLTALVEPRINNDGNGSIQVVLQVPKSVADDAYANVTVRFHLSADNNHVEMLGAELSKEQ